MSVETSMLPDEYLPTLDQLNQIVQQSGGPLEGNLFYFHEEPNPSRESVYHYFHNKRMNYVAACRASTRVLEIGFNAGHSALLALACGVEYHGVDICAHKYTQPAADFLKQTFGDRFHFYPGDSLQVVPDMQVHYPHLRFDLIHIDGFHDIHYYRADVANSIKMSRKNAWIIIDDTDLSEIDTFYRSEVQRGIIRADAPPGWIPNDHHAIGSIP